MIFQHYASKQVCVRHTIHPVKEKKIIYFGLSYCSSDDRGAYRRRKWYESERALDRGMRAALLVDLGGKHVLYNHIGVDLGSDMTRIFAGRGIVLSEPSVVAVDTATGERWNTAGPPLRWSGVPQSESRRSTLSSGEELPIMMWRRGCLPNILGGYAAGGWLSPV